MVRPTRERRDGDFSTVLKSGRRFRMSRAAFGVRCSEGAV